MIGDVGDDPQPARVRPGVDGPHGDVLVGAHVHRRRRHHRAARVLEHAARQHHRLDDLRADPAAPRHHRGSGLRGPSSSGRSGAASPAWSPRACSPSPCSGGRAARLHRPRGDVRRRPARRARSHRRDRDAGVLVRRRAARRFRRARVARPSSPSTCPTGRRRWPCSSPSRWPWSPAASPARPTPRRSARWARSPSSPSASLSPGNMNVNLMSANITAAAAGSSADLLTDLKSGYLLGAHPAQAVHRPVRRHLRRDAGHRAVPSGSSCRTRACWAPTSSPRPRPRPGAPWRVALSQGLGSLGPVKIWSSRSAGSWASSCHASEDLPEAAAPHPVAGRRRPGLDLPLVLRPALLPRRRARLVGREEVSEVVGGVHLPRGVRLDRRREPHGRGPRDLGERPGASAQTARPLIWARAVDSSREVAVTDPVAAPNRRRPRRA